MIGEENVPPKAIFKMKKHKFFSIEFIVMFLIHCIFPYPWTEHAFFVEKVDNVQVPIFLSEILLMGMMLRFFYIVKTLEGPNTYTDLFSKKIYKTFGDNTGQNIVFKILQIEYTT